MSSKKGRKGRFEPMSYDRRICRKVLSGIITNEVSFQAF